MVTIWKSTLKVRQISSLADTRLQRAIAIKDAGNIHIAISKGKISRFQDITVSEAVVLGLLLQGVNKFVSVLGHGTTEIGEVVAYISTSRINTRI